MFQNSSVCRIGHQISNNEKERQGEREKVSEVEADKYTAQNGSSIPFAL